MMGSVVFYRVKIGLYVLVIVMVGILFGVRVHNAWQRTNYVTEIIFENGDTQITLSYPAKILSAKNDASYPLTLAFYYTGDITSPHTYEVSLQSPTLLFVDAKGTEIAPRFQFTSDHAFLEQSVYARPYLSESYPTRHVIDIQVVADGQEAQTQPASIEIQAEPRWFSFFSLAAASLVEISVATALITWIVNAIDTSWTARKERVAKIREELTSLSSLSYLEQMDQIHNLDDEVRKENLDDDVGAEIKRFKGRFKEEEFFRALGQQLRQNKPIDFSNIQDLHNFLDYPDSHKDCVTALGKILGQESIAQENVLLLIGAITKIWDDFDVDAKDFIVGALERLSQKVDFLSIFASELLTQVFNNDNRRRLLRDVEIRTLFSQLGFLSPVGYDAMWLRLPNLPVNPRVIDWLKQHNLIANPFGADDFKSYPFYPLSFLPPDRWEDFLNSRSQRTQCPNAEDARALAFRLRLECLPVRKLDAEGEKTVSPGRQVFPVWVLVNQTAPAELPLITLTRSAAQAWLDILSFSPDAMLDLVPADQVALLELLCWAFGSNNTVINLLKRANPKDDSVSAHLLTKKISEFKSEISSAYLPQDAILISWLKIRPSDLHYTYLILHLDEFPDAARTWWLEQFGDLIPTLFLNGIVTKAFHSARESMALPLPTIQLNWSDARLKTSLNAQFEATMDKKVREEMGVSIDFRALFGSDALVGYFETEANTTDKLISASRNSLARMLTLGNRLLEAHCEQKVPSPHLSLDELQTILNSA